ncbi:MAG: hypothetical protein ABW128_05760 [Rhizorhabdus sp.]
MSIKTVFAAIGLAVAAMGVSGTAEARDRWDDRRANHDRRWDHDRHWDHDRRWSHDRRWDRDRHWKKDRRHYRHRAQCWTEWHRGYRYRVCR